MKWFDVRTATRGDVPGYYCLGFNAEWSRPRVRVGFYDSFDERGRFRLIGGPHMELGPTHIAVLPSNPDGEYDD